MQDTPADQLGPILRLIAKMSAAELRQTNSILIVTEGAPDVVRQTVDMINDLSPMDREIARRVSVDIWNAIARDVPAAGHASNVVPLTA